MVPYKTERPGEWRPKLVDGRATGPYTSWEGHGRSMLVQDWGAYGPGDCRTDRHRVPTEGRRLSSTETP